MASSHVALLENKLQKQKQNVASPPHAYSHVDSFNNSEETQVRVILSVPPKSLMSNLAYKSAYVLNIIKRFCFVYSCYVRW